jgi:ATP-binding protein involved in chromosome partitioning
MEDKNQEVWERLKQVRDPEFGKSIMERELVDEVVVDGEKAQVRYHLTVPFCPMPFALHIGREIREKALQVEGINEVEVIVQEHNQVDEINEQLRA